MQWLVTLNADGSLSCGALALLHQVPNIVFYMLAAHGT
jgi:hypothetical protein